MILHPRKIFFARIEVRLAYDMGGLFLTNKIIYSYCRCQKYKSRPIFVKELEIRLYLKFLSTQTCTLSPQIYILGTQTCTLCSTIASNIFALTFLPHLLATSVNLVLCIHVHK